jgi:hypothetical protein
VNGINIFKTGKGAAPPPSLSHTHAASPKTGKGALPTPSSLSLTQRPRSKRADPRPPTLAFVAPECDNPGQAPHQGGVSSRQDAQRRVCHSTLGSRAFWELIVSNKYQKKGTGKRED